MSAVQAMVSEQLNSLSHQQKADGIMTRAERDSRFVSLDESERTTLEMVHNHYQQKTRMVKSL